MIPCATAQRSILLAGTIAGALLAAPAFAQQPPASATTRNTTSRRATFAAGIAIVRPS